MRRRGGGGIRLQSISITAPPSKVSYKTGSLFDPTGMSVWAEFSNGYGLYVNHTGLAFDQAGPLEEGTKSVAVRFSWGGGTVSATQAIKVTSTQVFGAEWDGTSATIWSRTDEAAGFTDPVSYVAGAAEYDSPFDDIMPWAGMVRVTGLEAGELVAIPKFWFKWTKAGDSLELSGKNRLWLFF